jgi:hypothetical protein
MEPHPDGGPCYSKVMRANLLPGTFVLLAFSVNDDERRDNSTTTVATSARRADSGTVARIVAVEATSSDVVSVNVFKKLQELVVTGDFLYPQGLQDNHLRHLQEVVQTPELRVVGTECITNLCFVFTLSALQDTSTLASVCQGMSRAFFLRFRCSDGCTGPLFEVPDGCCLPFPSSYKVCVVVVSSMYGLQSLYEY